MAHRQLESAPLALLERLHYVTDAALTHLTVEELLDELLTRLREALHADSAAALLRDPDEPVLIIVAAQGPSGDAARGARVALGDEFERTASGRRAVVAAARDAARVGLPLAPMPDAVALMGAPLVVNGAAIGFIQVGAREAHAFDGDADRLLQLIADRAALALDHARLFEAERRARLASDAAVRARDEFLTIANHELKTPLTSVKSAAQLVRRRLAHPQPDNAELARLAATLESQIVRLEAQVADLLDTKRLERGRLALRPAAMDLGELCRDVLDMLRYAPERGPRHTLTLDAPEPVVGNWDRLRLERVFTNLGSNALKFLARGGEVLLQVRRGDERAEAVVSGRALPPAADADPDEFVREFHRNRESLMAGLFISAQTIEEHLGTILIGGDAQGNISYTVSFPYTMPEGL